MYLVTIADYEENSSDISRIIRMNLDRAKVMIPPHVEMTVSSGLRSEIYIFGLAESLAKQLIYQYPTLNSIIKQTKSFKIKFIVNHCFIITIVK